MNDAAAPYGRKTQRAPKIAEVHVLWITAGLGCDGDSVSITAASDPALKTCCWGPSRACRKSICTIRFWPIRSATSSCSPSIRPHSGELDNFVLVVEGSIPNENLSGDGYWAAVGTDAQTGQPIKTTDWINRLAPKALAVIGAGTCATFGGIHAMKGNPTGCMGLKDFLGDDWKSKAGLPIVNVPGCPVQPDNFMETLLYLLRQLAGLAPDDTRRSSRSPQWLFGPTVHEGLRPRRLLRAGGFRARIRLAQMPGENRLLGSGRAMQCAEARLDFRNGRMPERRRHLHRLHHAGIPRQVHAVHGRAAGRPSSPPSWSGPTAS